MAEWTGTGQGLHEAAHAAANEALADNRNGGEGDYEIASIHVTVRRKARGETGPNPLHDYKVTLKKLGGS